MPRRIQSDRLDFVKQKEKREMEYIMSGKPYHVPVGLNGERTDLTNLADVQQDIRDRFGLNVMGATPKN